MKAFGAIGGHFGAIQEGKLDPENHSGAVLSVFWSLFGAPKGLYHILKECVGPCQTGGDCGEPLGAIGGHLGPFWRPQLEILIVLALLIWYCSECVLVTLIVGPVDLVLF